MNGARLSSENLHASHRRDRRPRGADHRPVGLGQVRPGAAPARPRLHPGQRRPDDRPQGRRPADRLAPRRPSPASWRSAASASSRWSSVDDVPVALVVELTSDIQRLPDDSRERPILGVAHAADQRRCDDRFGAVEGRAGARPARPQVLTVAAAAHIPAAPAARHRHVGAGKSTVLDALEDMGWDCVDNLPTALLDDFVHGEREARQQGAGRGRHGRRAAAASIPRRCPACVRSIEGVTPEILYLDCAGAELIRRYDETRRRHPLAPDRPAEDGIARERGVDRAAPPDRRQRPRHHRPDPRRAARRAAPALRRRRRPAGPDHRLVRLRPRHFAHRRPGVRHALHRQSALGRRAAAADRARTRRSGTMSRSDPAWARDDGPASRLC